MDINHTVNNELNMTPGLGSTVSFSSLIDSFTYGDNHSQRMSKGINSLNMSMNLTFDQLTDLEAKNLISFFQESFFYEPQAWMNNGSFSNKRIAPFAYQPFFPYKPNNFYCLNFNHQKNYFNVNTVTASLKSASNPITDSVEITQDYNAIIQTMHDVTVIPNVDDSAILVNRSDNNLIVKGNRFQEKNIIYRPGSYNTYEIINDNPDDVSLSDNNSRMFPYQSNTVNLTPFVDGISSSVSRRNSIYIDDPHRCDFYPYPPLIARDGNNINLNCRMFDFRPSSVIQINHTPKHRSADLNSIYKKYNKYGFNPNLSNLKLEFLTRSDLEAKHILLFLEAHLGYKKFGFHLQKDYHSSINDTNTSPHRRSYQTFYCPEWSHTFNYADNHSISATFIECLDY